ncbi:MAG: hypothetical protein OXH65_05140 [Paracoccaceae bacterium]|nr:hypothetical protein [Paracoccaceae bacterium]
MINWIIQYRNPPGQGRWWDYDSFDNEKEAVELRNEMQRSDIELGNDTEWRVEEES